MNNMSRRVSKLARRKGPKRIIVCWCGPVCTCEASRVDPEAEVIIFQAMHDGPREDDKAGVKYVTWNEIEPKK